MAYKKYIESPYGDTPDNFHVSRMDAALHVELTYPPYTDADNTKGQLRYIIVDQESVRASDGVRLHYDYDRDGFVVEQNKSRLRRVSDNSYESVDDWIETGFFKSWLFGSSDEEQSAAADAEWEATHK